VKTLLEESKSFVCLAYGCAVGTVRVPKGTPVGTLIKHGCGSEAILSGDGRSWSLRAVDDPEAPEVIGELEAPEDRKQEARMETEVTTKKKRGRPKKVSAGVNGESQVTPATVDQNEEIILDEQEQNANLLRNIEAECPFEAGTDDFTLWCETQFDKRKKSVETQVPAKPRRGRKATAIVKSDEPLFDKEFIAEAKQNDRGIDKDLVKGGESFFNAIKKLVLASDKNYYKALGFKSFDTYRETKTAYSRSHIGQGIQAYKALHGRISDDTLASIPVPTAVLLTKIPESKLTAEVIEAAATMKIQDFKEKKYPEVMSQLVDATTGEAQHVPQEEWAWISRLRVHSPVAERWKKLMDMAKWYASGLVDENDVFGNFDLNEKAILAICMECSSTWEAEYQLYLGKKAEQEANAGDEPAF